VRLVNILIIASAQTADTKAPKAITYYIYHLKLSCVYVDREAKFEREQS